MDATDYNSRSVIVMHIPLKTSRSKQALSLIISLLLVIMQLFIVWKLEHASRYCCPTTWCQLPGVGVASLITSWRIVAGGARHLSKVRVSRGFSIETVLTFRRTGVVTIVWAIVCVLISPPIRCCCQCLVATIFLLPPFFPFLSGALFFNSLALIPNLRAPPLKFRVEVF